MNVFIQYTIEQIAEITGGKLVKGASNEFSHPADLALDSRKIISAPETIFFAIKTYHNDGNSFVVELYNRGVRNFVVSSKNLKIALFPLANIIFVNDSIVALQKLASHHRKSFSKIPVIGITGSNGKTVVKEWLNQLLENDYSIVRSPKSYNSQIGVPLSVLNMQESHTLGIFEAGISRPGEMQKLQKIIHPTTGILTNIGQAHDEGFENTLQKINEKLELFREAKQLIFCADNRVVKNAITWFKKEKNPALDLFSWGNSIKNNLKITAIRKTRNKSKIDAIFNKETVTITIPFTDGASVENAINCWCVLLLFGRDAQITKSRFLDLYPVAMRLELKSGINNCSIINDTYSNDLHSLEIATGYLDQQKQHKKHTIILSDILQSGKSPLRLYGEVAQILRRKNTDRIIAIGQDLNLQKSQFDFLKEKTFYNSVEDFLRDFYKLHFLNETILVKGARPFGFEKIVKKLEQKSHQTVLSINLNSVIHNLKQYRSLLKPETKVMAMVKAFSYGSGGFEIASVLEYHKVDYLAVAYTDEGAELRRAGITVPIMVMNVEASSFESLVDNNLQPEIFSFEILEELLSFLKLSGQNNYPIHIKVDTGMHRLGFTPEEIVSLGKLLLSSSLVTVESVFTHLVAAENPKEDLFTRQQFVLFKRCCRDLENVLGHKFLKHIANTSGISRHPVMQMDMVRLGIGLYGIDQNRRIQKKLKNVSTLTTTISQIKNVRAGDSVGYGRKAILNEDSIIATVRIGYADGYPRSLSNGVGWMKIKNTPVPIVGNVCMDMTMLDVSRVKNVQVGDTVTAFGEDLPLTKVADWARTIPYEIMTGISQRVSRVYYEE